MSIIIIVVSNITVLVSHNVIFGGYFVNMSRDFNNTTLPSASSSLSVAGLHQVFLLFYKKYFMNLYFLWEGYYVG